MHLHAIIAEPAGRAYNGLASRDDPLGNARKTASIGQWVVSEVVSLSQVQRVTRLGIRRDIFRKLIWAWLERAFSSSSIDLILSRYQRARDSRWIDSARRHLAQHLLHPIQAAVSGRSPFLACSTHRFVSRTLLPGDSDLLGIHHGTLTLMMFAYLANLESSTHHRAYSSRALRCWAAVEVALDGQRRGTG